MIQIAICEDDPVCQAEIQNHIESYCKEASLEIFPDGEAFCDAIENQGRSFDIVFMDIEMQKLGGIEAAERLRACFRFDTTLIIFLTSHVELAAECFAVNPFYFMKKPLDCQKFIAVLRWALERLEEGRQYFEYKKYRMAYRIPLQEICYFEKEIRDVRIVTKTGRESIRGRMDQIEEQMQRLHAGNFCRLHRGCIVNLDHVVSFRAESVQMDDGRELAVGAAFQEAFQKRIASLKQ